MSLCWTHSASVPQLGLNASGSQKSLIPASPSWAGNKILNDSHQSGKKLVLRASTTITGSSALDLLLHLSSTEWQKHFMWLLKALIYQIQQLLYLQEQIQGINTLFKGTDGISAKRSIRKQTHCIVHLQHQLKALKENIIFIFFFSFTELPAN